MASSRSSSLLVILTFFRGYGESGRTLPPLPSESGGDGSEAFPHDLRRSQILAVHPVTALHKSSIHHYLSLNRLKHAQKEGYHRWHYTIVSASCLCPSALDQKEYVYIWHAYSVALSLFEKSADKTYTPEEKTEV